jgi:hypothetical protein
VLQVSNSITASPFLVCFCAYVHVCVCAYTQALSVEHGLPWEELAAAAKLVHVTLGSVLNTSARQNALTGSTITTVNSSSTDSETAAAVTALSEGSLARVVLSAVPAIQQVAALWQCGAGAIDEQFVLVQRPSLGITETAAAANSSAQQQQLQEVVQVYKYSACFKHTAVTYSTDNIILVQSCDYCSVAR